jgi:hypothetical protein
MIETNMNGYPKQSGTHRTDRIVLLHRRQDVIDATIDERLATSDGIARLQCLSSIQEDHFLDGWTVSKHALCTKHVPYGRQGNRLRFRIERRLSR